MIHFSPTLKSNSSAPSTAGAVAWAEDGQNFDAPDPVIHLHTPPTPAIASSPRERLHRAGHVVGHWQLHRAKGAASDTDLCAVRVTHHVLLGSTRQPLTTSDLAGDDCADVREPQALDQGRLRHGICQVSPAFSTYSLAGSSSSVMIRHGPVRGRRGHRHRQQMARQRARHLAHLVRRAVVFTADPCGWSETFATDMGAVHIDPDSTYTVALLIGDFAHHNTALPEKRDRSIPRMDGAVRSANEKAFLTIAM